MVKLPEDDPALVHEMLVFLYSCDYNEEALYSCDYDETQTSTQHPFEFNARMYGLADKFGIEDLKDFAKYSLSQWLAPSVPYNDTSTFVKGLRVIYTTTLSSDRGLRDLVIPAFKQDRFDLRKDPDFVELLSSGWGDGEFAMDVFDALLELARPKTYMCNGCDLTTFPKRTHEEIECWKCKRTAAFIVAPELEP